jgi:hypothetical protein
MEMQQFVTPKTGESKPARLRRFTRSAGGLHRFGTRIHFSPRFKSRKETTVYGIMSDMQLLIFSIAKEC